MKTQVAMVFSILILAGSLGRSDTRTNTFSFTGSQSGPAEIQDVSPHPDDKKILVFQVKPADPGGKDILTNILVKFKSRAKARAAKTALSKEKLNLNAQGQQMSLINTAVGSGILVDAENIVGDRGRHGKPSLDELAQEQIRSDELEKGSYLRTLSGWLDRWLDKGTCQGTFDTPDCHDKLNKYIR